MIFGGIIRYKHPFYVEGSQMILAELGTARYAGLLLAPAESFGQGFFCPSAKKKELFMLFVLF